MGRPSVTSRRGAADGSNVTGCQIGGFHMRTVALIVAIALGIAAAVGVRSILVRQKREQEREYQPVAVATARESIEAGTELEPEMVSFDTKKPVGMLSSVDILQGTLDSHIGRELTRNVDRGSQILASYFIRREERSVSTILGPGKTAIAIGVDATSGVAGLIRPRDHVDIYATTTRKGTPETTLVLSQVEVLAVGDRLSDLPAGLPGYGRPRRGYTSLTLVVTPQEAQLLTYLKNAARLTFALRAGDDLGKPMEGAAPIDEANWRRLAEEANRKRRQQMGALPERIKEGR